MNHFHQNIETLRKRNGLSQAAMGDRYGISQTGYGRWEGNTVPDLETIIDLARFFQVTIDDLLTKDLSKATYQPIAGPALRVEEPGHTSLTPEQMEELKAMQQMLEQLLKAQNEMAKELATMKKELDELKSK